MKKILLVPTIALFLNCLCSFQAIAGDDPKYPAYDFESKVIYRSPELLKMLSPKPVSKPKSISQKKIQQKSSYPAKTKPGKPKQTSVTSANPVSVKQQSSGLSFGSYFMIALILAAIAFAYQDKISLTPAASAKPKPQSKVTTPSVAKNKDAGSNILVLSENVDQCQASTSKGTRCKRDTNLQLKRHSVNERTCQFIVCKQHDSDSFVPHPSTIKGV